MSGTGVPRHGQPGPGGHKKCEHECMLRTTARETDAAGLTESAHTDARPAWQGSSPAPYFSTLNASRSPAPRVTKEQQNCWRPHMSPLKPSRCPPAQFKFPSRCGLDQRQSLSFIRKRNGHRRSRTGVTSSTKHSAETRERKGSVHPAYNSSFQLVFSAETIFFSHNKSANGVFQLTYQYSRTGPKLADLD
jgi:hypothetical protein